MLNHCNLSSAEDLVHRRDQNKDATEHQEIDRDAVAIAQREPVTEQVIAIDDPTDFTPLLVTEGHHHGQPFFNK
jgi:hypothetical protein